MNNMLLSYLVIPLILLKCAQKPFARTINVKENKCDHVPDYSPLFTFCTNPSYTYTEKDCLSESPSCIEWCTSSNMNWTIINNKLGLVKFSMDIAQEKCCFTDYLITLRTFDDKKCSANSTASDHSRVTLAQEICEESCDHKCKNKTMEFDFKYLFTGCYDFEVELVRNHSKIFGSCNSEPFFIQTGYKKRLIGNSNMTIEHQYEELSELLYTSINFDVPFPSGTYPESVLVKLNSGIDSMLEDCTGTGKKEACCSTGDDKGKDCCIQKYHKGKECACKWENNHLDCKFSNISVGNYCLQVDFKDPRCDVSTTWANFNDCTWYFPFSFSATPVEFVEEQPNHFMSYWIIIAISIVASVILALLVILYWKTYTKDIYRQYISFAPSNKKSVSIITAPKLFLLYPRDCETFMEAMKEFRYLLQEILHAQVFDIWDNENWDNIAEVGVHWSAKYFVDPSVKIILVASPCTKLIEKAFAKNMEIEYVLPQFHDIVYFHSLKSAFHLVQTSTDRYNRYFVIRLDGKDCSQHKFELFRACTIYTLPQHLKEFVMDIHNMDSSEVVLNPDKLSRINILSTAIMKYEQYRMSNEHYLTEIINYSADPE